MAGLGYKAFTSGAVLTASQVQGYLQDQAVMKFATATARDAAIASPTEGMTVLLSDSNAMFVYDGANWCVVPTRVYYVSNADYNLTLAVGAQNLLSALGSGANLAAGITYEIEGFTTFKFTAGATAIEATMYMGYTGTATSSAFHFDATQNQTSFATPTNTNGFNPSEIPVNTVVAVTDSNNNRTRYVSVRFSGILRTTTGGTFVPQIGFSSATNLSAAVTSRNSFYKITPLGLSTVTQIGTLQ